jgi:hypothetical protein
MHVDCPIYFRVAAKQVEEVYDLQGARDYDLLLSPND